MLKIVSYVAIEITRRCNEHCIFCMRGEPQGIDISKEYIDKLLGEKRVIIANLTLSGGEPTLNEKLVEYIIDKIIQERLVVLSLQMPTNGLLYSETIIRAFERFYDYVSEHLLEIYHLLELRNPIVEIRISNDQFHLEANALYHKSNEKIKITYTGNKDILDDDVLLTGRAKKEIPFGRHFDYHLLELVIHRDKYACVFANSFYLTSTGFVTNQGDGEYKDMDTINLGRIEEFSFEQLLKEKNKQLEYK